MVAQYEIYWVNLNPTLGKEINKVRPCVILSPNEANKHFNTFIIAPYTSTIRDFPMRVTTYLQNKKGQIALDQLRTIDKKRLIEKIGILNMEEIRKVKDTLQKFLID